MKRFFIVMIICLCSAALCAQADKKAAKAAKKAKKDSIRQEKVAAGKSLISPLLIPGYTPELGALIAVGGLWSFKTNPKDDLIQRSSFPITISLTTTGAIVFQGRPTTYWLKDKLRITAELWYKDMPDNYWGVGTENGFNVEQSDSTTKYQREWFWIMPQFLYQFQKNYFVGLTIDYNYTQGSEPSIGVATDPVYQQFQNKPLNSGVGIIVRHDSRDIPVNAWKGVYVDLEAIFYNNWMGGDNHYQIYLVDYRQYLNLGNTAQTMAWQVKARFGVGDVPFGEMGQLGNPFDLRGYTWGRFRDKSLFLILPEYRQMFYNKKRDRYRHGVVAWVGTGTVFDFDRTDSQKVQWLPNFGVGYRLELQPRMNLRLDIGMGQGTSGIYFNFNEAF